jgi:hypothetical protein
VPFILTYFQASAAPRPENSDPDEKDALFGFDTQITIRSGKFSRKQAQLCFRDMFINFISLLHQP